MSKYHLLIVDDDPLILESLKIQLPSNWKVTGQNSPTIPRSDQPFDAALVDLQLGGDPHHFAGLDVIEKLNQKLPQIEIIAFSGTIERSLMEEALQKGAKLFLTKPVHPNSLRSILSKIEELLELKNNSKLRFLAQSPHAQNLHREIALLKDEPGPILIEGESGSGKEVVAKLLHQQRSVTPWITVNVASIPDNLFESEFFGHLRGSFTGAEFNKIGLCEAAHNGDLFLDEIEALGLSAQAKLLRFLESGEIRKVGSKEEFKVNCRVLIATNQSLEKMCQQGQFRNDLWWRISGKRIKLLPLRERPSDILIFANYFLKSDPLRTKVLDAEAQGLLKEYPWPGNIRQLRRVCEQLLLHAPLPIIRQCDLLPILKDTPLNSGSHPAYLSPPLEVNASGGLSELVNHFEGQTIHRCLQQHQNIDQTARVLKISRSSLYKKIKDHHIQWRGT
ncbi:MAG: sigma-54 dependent transcriptional regulator [Bdellovibrionales bacterium]|nr:sigma-54 dependent transcriptional regulator [Bdellovibrionales bacterium]